MSCRAPPATRSASQAASAPGASGASRRTATPVCRGAQTPTGPKSMEGVPCGVHDLELRTGATQWVSDNHGAVAGGVANEARQGRCSRTGPRRERLRHLAPEADELFGLGAARRAALGGGHE